MCVALCHCISVDGLAKSVLSDAKLLAAGWLLAVASTTAARPSAEFLKRISVVTGPGRDTFNDWIDAVDGD